MGKDEIGKLLHVQLLLGLAVGRLSALQKNLRFVEGYSDTDCFGLLQEVLGIHIALGAMVIPVENLIDGVAVSVFSPKCLPSIVNPQQINLIMESCFKGFILIGQLREQSTSNHLVHRPFSAQLARLLVNFYVLLPSSVSFYAYVLDAVTSEKLVAPACVLELCFSEIGNSLRDLILLIASYIEIASRFISSVFEDVSDPVF